MVLFRRRSKRSWLAKVSPLGKTSLASVFLATLLLSSCSTRPDTVNAVREFDINRYKGLWYEIMRLDHSFERGLTNVTATYEIREDGTVSVLNQGFDREQCRWEQANGIARFQGEKTIASLSVSFFWPFSGGYHVFALDKHYKFALVSGPSLDYLWILGRKPEIKKDVKDKLISKARGIGFLVDKLIQVDHSEIPCKLKS